MWGALKKSMSPSMFVSLLALVVALSGTSYAAMAIANNSVGSPQIKPGGVQTSDLGNNAVTSQKIKNGTIAASDLKPQVSQTQRALRSGETMRGTFLAAGADTTSGYIGTSITFPHRLPANFVKANVQYIDGATSTQCPGVGQAAPGWACFYEGQNSLATLCCIYSENYNDPSVGTFGTRIYWTVTGSNYVDGNWAITAP
jgi:hypothetical protein